MRWTDAAGGVLTPLRGEPAPHVEPDGRERVLHLSLRLPGMEGLDAQREAFALLGEYREVPWWATVERCGVSAMERAALDAARMHRPTVVVLQVQAAGFFSLPFLQALREACPAGALLVNWNGDVRGGPDEPPTWAAELGQGLDLFAFSNCSHAEALRPSVPCAVGFMHCGADGHTYRLRRHPWPYPGTGQAIFIGAAYSMLDGGERWSTMETVARATGALVLYGGGWADHAAEWHGAAGHLTSAHLYAGAAVSVSMNLREDLRRYSSGRLTRMLCSGAVCAVRAFDDLEGWGLQDGENCLVWSTPDDLVRVVREWTAPSAASRRQELREAAARLGAERYTWEKCAGQLAALVAAARAAGWPRGQVC